MVASIDSSRFSSPTTSRGILLFSDDGATRSLQKDMDRLKTSSYLVYVSHNW